MATTALTLPPAPQPARPRVLLVGTALVAGATFMGITALVGIYLAARAQAIGADQPWLPDGTVLPLTPGNMAFATLLISAVSMWWAVDAVTKNDRPMAYLALGLTLFFGVAVINLSSFLWAESTLPVASTPGLLLYTTTGAHLVMLMVAMAYAAVMTIRTLGGNYQGRDREGLTAAALFWFVTIAAYAPIWLAVYVTK